MKMFNQLAKKKKKKLKIYLFSVNTKVAIRFLKKVRVRDFCVNVSFLT